MGKDPAFLFYSSDFLTGVADLTMEERGQYITLLCLQHQHGHLSEKTICLSLGYRSVTEIGDVISKFQKDEQGLYYQHRLEEEIEKRLKYTDSRRSNGNKGGRPRNHMDNHMDNHEESISKPYGKPTDNHTENENINDNTNELEDKKEGTGGKRRGRQKKVFEELPIKSPYGSQNNVMLTYDELEGLKAKYPDDADDAIEFLSAYILEKDYQSKSHNMAIQRWVIDAVKEKKKKSYGNGNRAVGFGNGGMKID